MLRFAFVPPSTLLQFNANTQQMLICGLITHRSSCHRLELNPWVLYTAQVYSRWSSFSVLSATFTLGTFPPDIWNQSTHYWSLGRKANHWSLYIYFYIWKPLARLATWEPQQIQKPTLGDEVNCWNYVVCDMQYPLLISETYGADGRMRGGGVRLRGTCHGK